MTEVPETPPPDEAVPDFASVGSHGELVAWSRAYCHRAIAETDLSVDLDRVDWDVSTRAKRRAAAVLHPRIAETALGDPIDWGSLVDDSEAGGAPDCTIRLTWDAAQSYDRTTWTETLRHELVHVEQFQRFGTTGHGPRFEARATDLDTTVRCQRFSTAKFLLTCPDCETVVARRYRDCKLVRRHEAYRSSCCDAPLSLTRTGGLG